MTDPSMRQLLVEQATAAWRPRRPDGGVGWLPAWHDLDNDGRREAYQAARQVRRIEAALDPNGLSTTARAVLARLDER